MIKVSTVEIPELPTEKPRRLYVYLPADYEKTDRRYPVLYMYDGHNLFYNSHATYGRSWGMREYLKKTKLPLIVVGVECSHDGFNRLSEYSPWDFSAGDIGHIKGRGELTMEWMTKVLKPRIDAEYRTLPDRENTLIGGSSMGGLMALYSVVKYNSVFSGAISLSPTLYFNRSRMAELIKNSDIAKPTRVYMDYGSGETEEHSEPWENMFTNANRLSKKGAYVAARVVPGAMHNEAAWEKRIPVFFGFLLGENE